MFWTCVFAFGYSKEQTDVSLGDINSKCIYFVAFLLQSFIALPKIFVQRLFRYRDYKCKKVLKAGLMLRCALWLFLDSGRAVGDPSRWGRQENHGVMEKTMDSRARGNNVGKRITGLNWEWLWERTGSTIWFWGLNMKESEVGLYLGD